MMGTEDRGSRSRGRRAIAGLTGLAIAATLAVAPAQASDYTAKGTGTKDQSVTFQATVDATAKKGKLKAAKTINEFYMGNAEFECDVTGESGRADYSHMGAFDDPIEIAKNGKFSDVYEREALGEVLSRYTLKGKVVGKGRSMVITGTFKAELSEGGLKYGSCVTDAVPFEIKARL